MNMIKKMIGKIFPLYRFKLIRKEQELILRSIVELLPNGIADFKSQLKSLTFFGLSDWNLFPDFKFVNLAYSGNTINDCKKRNENYRISGLEIFSKKTQNYEAIEFLINKNLLCGFKISNSNYTIDEFDLKKIKSEKVIKSNFDFPPSEIDLFYDSLDSTIKLMLNPDDLFDIDHNNRTFYAFYDLEDGNYLAVDKNQNVYSLIHDARPIATRIKYTFEEILFDIKEGRFDKDKHFDDRYKKSK